MGGVRENQLFYGDNLDELRRIAAEGDPEGAAQAWIRIIDGAAAVWAVSAPTTN